MVEAYDQVKNQVKFIIDQFISSDVVISENGYTATKGHSSIFATLSGKLLQHDEFIVDLTDRVVYGSKDDVKDVIQRHLKGLPLAIQLRIYQSINQINVDFFKLLKPARSSNQDRNTKRRSIQLDLLKQWRLGLFSEINRLKKYSKNKAAFDRLAAYISKDGGHIPNTTIYSRLRFELPSIEFSSIENLSISKDGEELCIHSLSNLSYISAKMNSQTIKRKLPFANYSLSNATFAWYHIGRNIVPISLELVRSQNDNQCENVETLLVGDVLRTPSGDCIRVDKVICIETKTDHEDKISNIALLVQGICEDGRYFAHDSSSQDPSMFEGSSNVGEDELDDTTVITSPSGDECTDHSLALPCNIPIKARYYVVFVKIHADGLDLLVESIISLEHHLLVDQTPRYLYIQSNGRVIVHGSNGLLCLVFPTSSDGSAYEIHSLIADIKSIYCGDPTIGEKSHEVSSHIICVSASKDSNYLVSGDDCGTLCVWRTDYQQRTFDLMADPFCPIYEQKKRIDRVVMSPSGRHIAVCMNDRLLLVSMHDTVLESEGDATSLKDIKSTLYVRSVLDILEGFRVSYHIAFQEEYIRIWRITHGVKFDKMSKISLDVCDNFKRKVVGKDILMYGLDSCLISSGVCITTWTHCNIDSLAHRFPLEYVSEFDDELFGEYSNHIDAKFRSKDKSESPQQRLWHSSTMLSTPSPTLLIYDRALSPSRQPLSNPSSPYKLNSQRSPMSKRKWSLDETTGEPTDSSYKERNEMVQHPALATMSSYDKLKSLETKTDVHVLTASPTPELSKPSSDFGLVRIISNRGANSKGRSSIHSDRIAHQYIRSTSNLDDVPSTIMSMSGQSTPVISKKITMQLPKDLFTRLNSEIYSSYKDGHTKLTEVRCLPINITNFQAYDDNDELNWGYLILMRNLFSHDKSDSFLLVKPFLAVYCAAFTTPSIGLISAALDIEPFMSMNLVEETPLSQIFLISEEPRSSSDDLWLQEHLKPLKSWLVSPNRVCQEFWIDSSIGHNYLCALHLRFCGNKSVAVECIWHDYLRIYGPTHLRMCSRGLRDMTINVRKIDETVGIKDSLPPQIGYIAGLQEIYARRVGLKGRLPLELGELSQLRVLSMGNNKLCGQLPESLGNLKNLQRIVLHQNALTGEVPDALGRLGCIVNLAGNIGLEPGSEVPTSEIDALIDLYRSTSGDKWNTKTNWLSSNPVCTWYKVGVLSSHVHSIVMSSNGMEGRLPASIGKLTQLRMIELATMTGLVGPIPVQLCSIVTLRRLCICRCGLQGPIPEEIGRLINLEELQLFGNNLSGTIPASIGNLKELKLLSLGEYTGGNSFMASPLPICLSKLKNLEALFMANCNVKGSVPYWIAELTELRQLDLQRNHLHGGLPDSIGNLSNLLYLNLKDNEGLNGHLPVHQMASLTKLNRLSLVHCNFVNAQAAVDALQAHLPRCKIWI